MFDAELYYKTPKGREEIMYRNHHLLPRLRTALVLVDGKTPWAELKNYLVMLGEPERLIQQLAELGMVESDHQLPPVLLFPFAQANA
ncbi:MAG TPA: hypothetical protein VFW00_03185 [Rhodocyclaceae bacterium]|nr:hypothetical protein [Rhodocyclaceae bacterium]